jgi:hypothetical protein
MLKTTDRDLLVISKAALESDDALQQEVQMLNQLLHEVEILKNIADSAEIFDLNRCRIFKKSETVIKQLQEKSLRSFVFICNKN